MLIEQSPHLKKPSKLDTDTAIVLLTFATVVFRAEVLLLLVPIALQALWLRYITFSNLLVVGIVSGLASLYVHTPVMSGVTGLVSPTSTFRPNGHS
jgi:alpha-1,6-mannosyltransferase